MRFSKVTNTRNHSLLITKAYASSFDKSNLKTSFAHLKAHPQVFENFWKLKVL